MQRGEVWWANLPELQDQDRLSMARPGSAGRPIQHQPHPDGDRGGHYFKRGSGKCSRQRPAAGGSAGPARDSVVNVSQLLTLDRGYLTDLAGTVSAKLLRAVDDGLRLAIQL